MLWPSRSILWILLAVGFLLVLLAATTPAYGTVSTSAEQNQTQAMARGLQIGIERFKAEYGTFPSASGQSREDVTLEAAGPWLGALFGEKAMGNPRGLTFLETPMVRSGKRGAGLTGEPGNFRLVDWWRHPFQVIMDGDGDGQIANPDLRNSDPRVRSEATAMLPSTVLVFSSGPDGLPYTADDFPSWRRGPPIKRDAVEQLLQPKVLLGMLGLSLVVYSITGLIATRNQNWNRTWPY